MNTPTPEQVAQVCARSTAWARRYAARLPWNIDGEVLAGVVWEATQEAAARFDPARGVRFVTYALPWVQGKVRHACRDQGFGPRKASIPLVNSSALLDSEQPAVEDFADGVTLRIAIRQALAALSPREREALLALAAGEAQRVTARRWGSAQYTVSKAAKRAAGKAREALLG
jgi:RNA polymerase sigma factor (sigma-70 family)